MIEKKKNYDSRLGAQDVPKGIESCFQAKLSFLLYQPECPQSRNPLQSMTGVHPSENKSHLWMCTAETRLP